MTTGVSGNEPSERDELNRRLLGVEKQVQGAKEFVDTIEGLVKLFERYEKETGSPKGLWRENGDLSLADVMVAPCKFRVKGRDSTILALFER